MLQETRSSLKQKEEEIAVLKLKLDDLQKQLNPKIPTKPIVTGSPIIQEAVPVPQPQQQQQAAAATVSTALEEKLLSIQVNQYLII